MYKFPLKYIAITQLFTSNHKGIDMAWNSNYGGKNAPIYASADGIVYSTNDNDKTGKSWGNYVKISHGNNEYTLYAHLKDGLCVSKGQNVKQGDLIGYIGNTGRSDGNHLHFEFYKGGASTSYRVNPLDYVYAYSDQVVHQDDVNKVKHYIPTPIISGVEIDNSKDQIKVVANELRVRANHTTESGIVGVTAQNDVYNWIETYKDDSYTWYKINDNQWVANNGTWVEELKKEEPKEESKTDEKDVLITAQQKEIQELKDKLELERKSNESHQKYNEELKNKIKELEEELSSTNEYKYIYNIEKDGIYQIECKNGEILIIK